MRSLRVLAMASVTAANAQHNHERLLLSSAPVTGCSGFWDLRFDPWQFATARRARLTRDAAELASLMIDKRDAQYKFGRGKPYGCECKKLFAQAIYRHRMASILRSVAACRPVCTPVARDFPGTRPHPGTSRHPVLAHRADAGPPRPLARSTSPPHAIAATPHTTKTNQTYRDRLLRANNRSSAVVGAAS